MHRLSLVLLLLPAASLIAQSAAPLPVAFTGGYAIGPNDFGRPVNLIAGGLDVTPDVFRQAFSGVTPARGREPSGDEARQNKTALLKTLAPHGVTNERMDEVANYYRFQPQSGTIWPTRPAMAHATVVNGKIIAIVIDDPGAGYNVPPAATVSGFGDAHFRVTLKYQKELTKNGGVAAVEVEK